MSSARLRLLLFVTDFRFGGTERYLVTLARSLDVTLFEVRVACLRADGEFRKELDDHAIPVTAYPIHSLYGIDSLQARIAFARDLVRHRIQVVHALGFYPTIFALPAARVIRTPIVVSIRDNGDLWSQAQRRALRLVCRSADRVLVNAGVLQDRLISEGYDARSIGVIPNGIDLDKFHPGQGRHSLRREFSIPPHAPIVGVIARLNRVRGAEIKGVGDFLEAAVTIAAAHPGTWFLVVGEGDTRAELQAQAQRLGLGSRVVFTGFRFDVAGILAELSVAVVPSLTEATSNSLLEAMASEVPVVATRVGGTPEVVTDDATGLLVPAADPDALARAVLRLLEDRALASRLAIAGRLRVESSYSLRTMIEATQECYLSLRGRRSAPPPVPQPSAPPQSAAPPPPPETGGRISGGSVR